MTYEYKRPEGELYKVSLRKWNKYFAKRGQWPFEIAEVYIKENEVVIQYTIGKFGKFALVFLTPIFYLIGTFSNGFPETHRDIKDLWFQKRRGAFSKDIFFKNTDRALANGNGKAWDKLMEMLSE